MLRNNNLYTSLKEYCKESLTLINGQLNNLPIVPKEKFVFNESGYSATLKGEVAWFLLAYTNEENIKQTMGYKTALKAMQKSAKVKKHLNNMVGSGEQMAMVDANQCLITLLSQLLNQQRGLDFSK